MRAPPKRKTLAQRVEKLERELKAALSYRNETTREAIYQGMKQFQQEHSAREIDRAVARQLADVERRLLEQLRPHMVEVKVEYKGVYEPGDEFTVRA